MTKLNIKAHQIVHRLKEAVKKKNTEAINKLYAKAKLVDWDQVADHVFTEYDQLVDKANEIILN